MFLAFDWLKIKPTGSNYVKDVGSVSTPSGERFILECESESFPTATITWFKNSRELSPKGNIGISQTGPVSLLVIDDAKETDQGDYYCKGDTSALKKDSDILKIKVIASAWAVKPAKIVSERIGEELRIECVPNSHISDDIYWHKESSEQSMHLYLRQNEVSEDSRIRVDHDGTLIIKKVQKSDEGDYSCIVGDAQAPTTVTIIG